MNDAVDRLIVEREAMDHGFGGGVAMSIAAHLLLLVTAVVSTYLRPRQPPLHVVDGFAVPMPPGGAGSPNAEPAAASAAPEPAAPEAPPAKPAPKPEVIKPPSKSEPKKKGLPELNAKKTKSKPEPERPAANASNPPSKSAAGGGTPGGKGTGAVTPGLEFGPPGPGVPGGTDLLGDWYLAGVQRKIWSVWMQQIKVDFSQAITVRFTILGDGNVADVQVVESSGASLLDNAAQRAIYSAAPFGPLPKNYGTDKYTIQAVFKPSS